MQALRRDSALSTAELQAKQWRDLQTLVREARKAPFWAARLRGFCDPISPADYARLPLLTKDDLRQHGAELLIPGAPVAQTGSTSGSTGVAISIKIPATAQESNFACQWYALLQ